MGESSQVRWVCSLRSSAWPDAFVMVWFNSTQDKKVHTLGHAGYEPWTGRAMKRRRGDGDGVPRPLKSVFIARGAPLGHVRKKQLWWLVEFADDGETSTSPDATEHTTQTDTNAPLYWKLQRAYTNSLAELGDGRCLPVVTTFCADGVSRVSASAGTMPPWLIGAGNIPTDLLKQAA